MAALPFAPDFKYFYNLPGALASDSSTSATLGAVQKLAGKDEFAQALKTAKMLDTVDSGLGVVTGVRNIYSKATDKDRQRTFEADPQQAADAAVKLLGIAYMIAVLFPGGISEKIAAFLQTRAG